ncbi:MAG TPA: branched-chain amino acid aminotransferase [Candidatus Limnocylindria bacterium]|nr:branched-chain amino acid aminotransferase [Candidatus Limnocylindria bacterium]
MLDIKTHLTDNPKRKPAPGEKLGFGQLFTDHMFQATYTHGEGWHDAEIVPYGPIALAPSSMALHYGQAVFEGLKAYRAADGRILLFRPEMNARRLGNSCRRLCMPAFPEEDFLAAVHALVRLEEEWTPTGAGESLYIRPFVFATEGRLGVSPSAEYRFMVILSPSGSYYPGGLAPIGIRIEEEYVRAARGGMGHVKAAGNYAVSLIGQIKAHEEGYSQVLWLDAVHRKYVEEVGAMNIFFKVAGEVVTPALSGSILPGVTRDSVLRLCELWGVPAREAQVSADDLADAWRAGQLEEVFGAGTAAVISPVGKLAYRGLEMRVGDGIGALSARLYQTLTDIQWGRVPDPFGWVREA